MDKEEFIKRYPNVTFEKNIMTVDFESKLTLVMNKQFDDIYFFSNDKDFATEEPKLTKIIENVMKEIELMSITNPYEKASLIINSLKDDIYKNVYGFDFIKTDDHIEIIPYDSSIDPFWKKMIDKYKINTLRKIEIVTYGTTFIFEKPSKCENVYNAAVLRGAIRGKTDEDSKKIKKQLIKLRGDSLLIQSEIRSCDIFENFMENMIKDIEENNYSCIAITCRAGHHRSVACAHMLANIYINIGYDHMTL